MKQDGSHSDENVWSHSGTSFTIVGTNTALQTNETRWVTFWHTFYHSWDEYCTPK